MTGQTPKANSRPRARPLSPHLQIYRWPITMATSILHRATGVANAGGLVLITLWLLAAAQGSDAFAMAQGALGSLLGRLILFGFTVAAVYHLANGIRHLVWDTGAGFGLKTSAASGVFVFVFTAIATLIIWIAAYWIGGAF